MRADRRKVRRGPARGNFDATRATADFLLGQEPGGWRALNMRTTGLAPRTR